MPALGETWSVARMGQSRLEAVVIATGPTMIRLVTRVGSRITLPAGSWHHWVLVSPTPEMHTCCNCRQTAFFRHTVGGETVWVCEDHLPHGAIAYLPGDVPGPAALEMACPSCESTEVIISPTLVPLADARTTTLIMCEHCGLRWSSLIGRGLGDDGAILAADLTQMIQQDPSISQIWVGFVAYRNLCRAVGMGDVSHIHGVTLVSTSILGDCLTVVISRGSRSTNALNESDSGSEALTGFGTQFPALEIPPETVSSVWRRRASPPVVLCSILSSEDGHVRHLLAGQSERTRSLEDFILHWTPDISVTERPREWTVWRHVETRQLVQVTRGTPTQNAQRQVSYLTVDGQPEATPLLSFYRLYVELPTPPELHRWCKDGCLFEVERSNGDIFVRPYELHEESRHAPRSTLGAATFYELYAPLSFMDVLDEPAATYPRKGLKAGARWHHEAEPERRILIVDLARVGSDVYVRFMDENLRIMSVDAFLVEFAHELPTPPCQTGETWVSLLQPSTQGIIYCADVKPFDRAFVRWNDGSSSHISHDELVEQFRKLDVRSYWEILDSEDAD